MVSAADALLRISGKALVFLRTTWHNVDLDPIVVARCMEIRLAIVPSIHSVSSGYFARSFQNIFERITYLASQKQYPGS